MVLMTASGKVILRGESEIVGTASFIKFWRSHVASPGRTKEVEKRG
jgi:hypothetical protein